MKKKLLFKTVFSLLILSSTIFRVIAVPDIENAYANDFDALLDSYSDAYSWDTDDMTAPTWTRTIDGEQVDFSRRTGWQKEFLDNNILTTKQYLGFGGSGVGMGVGGGTIVAIAEAEYALGEIPHETAEVGGDNRVKYNNQNGLPWCSYFVSWCAQQAGYIDSGLFTFAPACVTLFDYLTQNGADYYHYASSTYVPNPGDIVFWIQGGVQSKNTSNYSHIGIVTEATQDSITVIEGNSSNKVSKNVYTRSKSVLYIVAVNYPASGNDTIGAPPTGEPVGVFKLTGYCPCTHCSDGWGTQTSSGAPATEGVTIAADTRILPLGTKVYIEGVGERIVQDVGGAIKQYKIDIFVNDHNSCFRSEFNTNARVWIIS